MIKKLLLAVIATASALGVNARTWTNISYDVMTNPGFNTTKDNSVLEAKNAWEAKNAEARALLDAHPEVVGQMRFDLEELMTIVPENTVESYEYVTHWIDGKILIFSNAIAYCERLKLEIDAATPFATTQLEDANTILTSTSAEIEDLAEIAGALNCEVYEKVVETYTMDVTSLLADGSNTFDSGSGQHWDWSNTSYAEKRSGSALSVAQTKTATLTKGKYVLMVAARSSEGAKVTVSDGCSSIVFPARGDVGAGIDTNGNANFENASSTFANDEMGYGWEWMSLPFELTEETAKTFTATAELGANTWASVATWQLLKVFDVDAELAAVIAEGEALLPKANVGSDPFQYDNVAVTELEDDINIAKLILIDEGENSDDKVATYNNLKALVDAAKDYIYILNTPDGDDRYSIKLVYDGYAYHDKAITYNPNSSKSAIGGYEIQYAADVNENYAQAFAFYAQENPNLYKLGQMDEDGVERFLCTGTVYGGDAKQICTTTDVNKALRVEVRATDTEGKWNLWNTEANMYIGSQDAGVYTVDSHIDFSIEQVEEANVPIKIGAGKFITRIFPFTPSGFDEITYYAFDGVKDGWIQVTETATVDLKANTPYLLYAFDEVSQEEVGWGLATKDAYETNNLVGVYTPTEINSGYVLQTKDDKQSFRKVTSSITVPAYRAYINFSTEAKSLSFILDESTGVSCLNALTEGNVVGYYDAAGKQLPRLHKGMNIVKMADGKTLKIMVK